MHNNALKNIEKVEGDLWEAADNLRANSKLSSSEYCMPVLGIIFLRHAANRFEAATRDIESDQAAGKMPNRPVVKADYVRRRALFLPESARYDRIMEQAAAASDLGKLLTQAMTDIEKDHEPLANVLPKEYGIFEKSVLESLLRTFNTETLKQASGDLFGRIYEYFLMKFAMEGAQDKGEFFTPPSLVQTIVNIIEPNHGTVFDPACGSGGMFVQTSHFLEDAGQDTAKLVTFYGQEKTATTIKLAKMNLAVHGLDGNILEANTFYQDEHNLAGECDFVMANPPFNVDMVDAEKAKEDQKRLPFGLPGVNKEKKVSNGNYLWISYFWSYLNERGRAGFVMSSQASSAGHGEKEVRRKILETGDVDVMVSIRANFFYTRSVPCELWFFDRDKPELRGDKVLMLDARNIFRKVTRKIYDFSPEQLANLTAIVWLYRGERERFLRLVQDYFAAVCDEAALLPAVLTEFDSAAAALVKRMTAALSSSQTLPGLSDTADGKLPGLRSALSTALTELCEAANGYETDRDALLSGLKDYIEWHPSPDTRPSTPDTLSASRLAFVPLSERLNGLVKQADLRCKLTMRAAELASELGGQEGVTYDRRAAAKEAKRLDCARRAAVEQLKAPVYQFRQAAWLLERFPDGELRDVPGLVKLVSRAEISAADWSLTPGRYVGVAPQEEDADFDFEETLRSLHLELADLNREASELAAKIQTNFEELGI